MRTVFIKKSKIDIILAILSIFILSIVILFPVLNDISIFYSGGIRILEGKKLYVDWIDIKPPAIYYLFAGIISVFGKSEMAVRLFDFLYQLITEFSLFYLAVKRFKSQRIGIIACLFYSIIYILTNHYSTMQAETFAILPFIWSIYYFTKEKIKSVSIFYSGVLFGLACGFKYTFAFAFLGYLISICTSDSNIKIKAKNISVFFVAGILGLLITSIPLLDPQVRTGYFQLLEYLKYYVTDSRIIGDIIHYSIISINSFYGDYYSIPITAFAIYGLLRMIKDEEHKNIGVLLFFTSIGFLISIFIENKFMFYHFSRILFIYVIFAAYGFYYFIENLNILKNNTLITKFTILVVALLALYISPLPRVINIFSVNKNHVFHTDVYDKNYRFQSQTITTALLLQYKTMANYINSHAHLNDTYMVINLADGSFADRYIKLNDKNYIFAQSCFCNGIYKYYPYYQKYLELIKNSDWLIISNNDVNGAYNSENLSSYQKIISDSTTKQILDHSFCLISRSNDLFLYKKSI